ncbi:hypothetical protein [Streptantibioticus ferralitis]|uniref:Uncharacterized protein n=1 Tax=Streptantibioticus ferralitis TaxID=236510 RepID=A0ABT5YWY8_9ACTN|nr:hypothetical protein [Streptantibioticus ferralitis]MDF2256122.1 hypothetical protein [Streptantibioticus ferralitis]
MLSSPSRLGHGVLAVLMSALLLLLPACSSKTKQTSSSPASASASQDKVRFAKTKFVANASLASGAVYQWIYKPYKAGTFQKGARGRTAALVKGGLAAAFAYNRFKAAIRDAQGDPLLSKAVAPLTGGVDKLKDLGSKIKGGNATDSDFNQIQNTVNGVKNAGSQNGANVTDNVPSLKQIGGS